MVVQTACRNFRKVREDTLQTLLSEQLLNPRLEFLRTLRSCPILILSVSRFLKNSIILCKIFGRNHISILLTSSCRLSKKKIFFWRKTTSINYFSRLLDRASIDPCEGFFFCNIAMKVLVSCIGWRLFQQCQLRRILFSEK